MKTYAKIIVGLLGAQLATTAFGASDLELEQLKKQLADLDQKVRILEREREIDQEGVAAAAKTAPKLSLGANGFVFASGDSNFVAQLHALAQFDTRSFFNDGGNNGNDGFLVRRARPIFTGTVFHDFDFNFTPDFGGSTVQIQDAYVNYRYQPELQVQVGKFKSPVGLELLQTDPATAFNERSIASDLVPNRDLGIDLHGDLAGGVASYAVGIFNGATDNSGTTTNAAFQDNKAVVARAFFQPWKNTDVNGLRGLGFGVGGSYAANHPNAAVTGLTAGYLTDGQQSFFKYSSGVNANGAQWRFSPQASYYYGPLGVLAEYVISDQKATSTATPNKVTEIQNRAWEITGSWLLTGEDASYAAITPLHPFDPRNNQWGAWQLVARFGELDVDHNVFAAGLADATKYASGAQAWSLGLNWFLNKNIRANLSYSRTTFTGYTGTSPSATSAAAQPENVLFSRLQLVF